MLRADVSASIGNKNKLLECNLYFMSFFSYSDMNRTGQELYVPLSLRFNFSKGNPIEKKEHYNEHQ